ncbi:TRAG family protein, partial [Bacillus thuringiensis]
MSEIHVGKMKKIGKLGEDVMQRKSAWLSEELMQA